MVNKRGVLIVEDDYFQAQLISVILKSYNFETAGITDKAEQAIKMAEELDPYLIFMDISLAGKMNGFEAAAVISKNNNKIPIIFITGHSSLSSRAKVEEVGGSDLFIKPIERKTILDTVEKYLSKNKNSLNQAL